MKEREERNASLLRLDVLVGAWEMQMQLNGQVVARGSTTFEWMEGRHFMLQHADGGPASPEVPTGWIENSPFPTVSVFGLDDTSGAFTMLYSDARGVARVYQMAFEDGVLRLRREAPGFNQRFTGRLSNDRSRIDAYWEFSEDGQSWQKDFDITYERVG